MHLLRSFGLLTSLAVFCLAVLVPAQAQNPDDQTLHVLRTTLHTEGDKAELCLEFDHALDASGRAHAVLHLDENDKTIAVPPQNISVNDVFFCLPQLDYGKNYHLTLARLRGTKNEALGEPYDATFTVPSRHPALTFTGDMSDGLMHWSDAPILRSVNVAAAHVELYRITAPDDLTSAWFERQQTALAPSESAYFARHKGQLVWQGDVNSEGPANRTLEEKIPFPQDINAPGLYLVVASAPDVSIKPSEAGLTPLAAAWILRSGIAIHTARGPDGIYALAESKDAALPGIHMTLFDQDRHPVAETRTGADGTVLIPLPEDKQNSAVLLFAEAPAGDLYFADLAGPYDRPVLAALEANISTGHPFYPPGQAVDATLALHDVHGHAVNIAANGTLQVLRSDRSPYTHIPVPAADNGTVHLSFPAPATDGLWPLLWQGAGGATLAETVFRVTPNPDAPRLRLEADRGILSGDNEVSLKISGVTALGAPQPFISGRVLVGWTTPEHVFPGWDDYRFGGGETSSSPPQPAAAFLADAGGMADVHLTLKPPTDAAPLRAAVIDVISDPAAGAADPTPLVLPSSPSGIIIGIKPLAEGGRFAENGTARFSVVALDANGKRTDADNLSFQIYDEGRSFEWYQAEGRWDYKPMPQSRQIGGKTFSVKAQGDTVIEWPVTSGTYRLDIADAEGEILARMDFGAGWELPRTDTPQPAHLEISSPARELHSGDAAQVHFALAAPSMVALFIADDHIRKVVYQAGVKGDNVIAFTPEKDWGDHILLHVVAYDANAAGEIVLPLTAAAKPDNAKEKTATLPALALPDWTPPMLAIGDTLEKSLEIKNDSAPGGTYKYAFSVTGAKIPDATGTLALAPGQSKTIAFGLHALEPGAATLRLDITGPHGFRMSQVWNLFIRAAPVFPDKESAYKLEPEQTWPAAANKSQAHRSGGFLLIAPQPLFDAPQILGFALEERPIATSSLAERLEMLRLWHDTTVRAGFLSGPLFASLQDETLLRLLQRQKPDGGFPALPDGESDLVSTAAAAAALTHSGQQKAQPATEEAASWLRRRLENTWFDESERPQRAAVYALLADANLLDQGSLRFFSDTSTDKSLPPIANVQLAAAFASINDRDKAQSWLDRTQIKKGTPDIDAALLPILAANTFVDPGDLLPALQQLSHKIVTDSDSRAQAALFLRTLMILQNRAGGWRVTINGAVKTTSSIYVIPAAEKLLTLANPNDGPIYIAESAFGGKPRAAGIGTMARHIYRLDGTRLEEGAFRRGEIYLFALEGDWPAHADNGAPLLVRDDPGPGFTPLNCAIDGAIEVGEALKWVKNLGLAPLTACEKPGRSVFTLITRANDGSRSWRIAYLAAATESGSFNAEPAHAYSEDKVVADEEGRKPVKISR